MKVSSGPTVAISIKAGSISVGVCLAITVRSAPNFFFCLRGEDIIGYNGRCRS